MIQGNGQSQSQPDPSKPRGNYTGERLLRERPRVYRKVVESLAEPREQMSIRQICRLCHVTDDTVKAVQKREATSIAARKQTLLSIALNVAEVSGQRLEELAPTMNAREAGVSFGIATDKAVLLSGTDPATNIGIELKIGAADNGIELLNSLAAKLEAKAVQAREVHALPSREIISDSVR